MNFIPSKALNNLQYDGLQTLPLCNDFNGDLAEIKEVIWTRDGTRFPNQYNLTTNIANVDINEVLVLSEDPQIVRDFMNSIIPFEKNKRTQQSPITNDREGISNPNGFVGAGKMSGLGIAYDTISGQGVDFRGVNWGCNIDCGLTNGASFPNSVFLFVHSKQTLVFNENGIQVIT